MNYENSNLERDRLYLNIVTDYDVDIYDINIDVILPGMFNLTSISAESYYSISPTDHPEIVNSTTNTIIQYHEPVYRVRAGEDYTLDIFFPATVERPPPTLLQIFKGYLDLSAPWYSIGMIIFGILAVIKFRSFKRRFKDPEVSTIGLSRNQPPRIVRPPEAGVLSDMKVSRKHFDSALLDLAQRGYLEMHIESKETGILKKSVKVESFKVRLSEKGKNDLQYDNPDLKRYEWYLLKSIGDMPLDKEELATITNNDVKEKFGFIGIKEKLIEKDLVHPGGFEKKGTNLMILGVVLAFLGVIVIGFYLFTGSKNWWMGLSTFLPAVVFGVARTKGPRTIQGAKIHMHTKDFLERKVKELKELVKRSPISTIKKINEFAPWLALHQAFYSLVKAPEKAIKKLDTTSTQHTEILPSYVKVITSERQKMTPYYYYYGLWCILFATTSPSTGAPAGGGGAGGGGAGGGAGGGGGGAG